MAYFHEQTHERDKIYLSFQKINVYSRCGIQYYLRYIENIIVPVPSFVVFGRAFHSAIQTYLLEKRDREENPELDLLLSSYSDTLKSIFQEEEVHFEEEEKLKGKEKVIGELEDLGIKGLKVYHRDRISKINPGFIEERFQMNLFEMAKELNFNEEEFKNILLVGQIDLIDTSGKIIDHKTRPKGTSVPKNEVEKSQQLTIYALGYKQIFGELPKGVELDYILLSGKNPKVTTLTSERNEEDLKRMMKRILRIAQGIKKGVFIPPDQSSWACSYCMYKIFGYCDEYIT